MRLQNLAIVLIAVGFMAAFSATSARADSLITLGGSNGGFTFTGTGSRTSISFTIGNGSPLIVTGTAQNGFPDSGYVYLGPGTTTLTEVSSTLTSSYWTASSTQTFSFCFSGSSTSCTSTNAYLQGTLSLVDLSQTNSTANTDTLLSVNLTNLSGTDASYFGNGGVLGLTLDLSPTNLDTLLGSSNNGKTLTASLSSGEVDTPEPSTTAMLLLGLLAVGLAGAFVRRRGALTAAS